VRTAPGGNLLWAANGQFQKNHVKMQIATEVSLPETGHSVVRPVSAMTLHHSVVK